MSLNDQTTETPNRQIGFPFWREVRRTFGFPLTMFTLAVIPGLNFTYSAHGGPAWFLIPFCCPYILLRATFKVVRAGPGMRRLYARFFAYTIPAYIALVFPLSWAATASLQRTFGLTIPAWSFMGMMISPYPYWFFS